MSRFFGGFLLLMIVIVFIITHADIKDISVPCETATTTVTVTNLVTQTLALSPPVSAPYGQQALELSSQVPLVPTDGPITLTVVVTFTSTVDLVPVVTPTSTGAEGPYSFFVTEGITSWLDGKTPHASISTIVSTMIETLEPIPSIVPFTTFFVDGIPFNKPITLTSVEKSTSAEVLTESLPTFVTSLSSSLSTKASSKVSLYGWNATASTFQTLKVGTDSRLFGTDTPASFAYGSSSSTVPKTTSSFSISSTIASKEKTVKKARRNGPLVEATIDGVIVSWSNNYSGQPRTSSTLFLLSSETSTVLASPTYSPAATLAPIYGNGQPTTPATSQTSSSTTRTAADSAFLSSSSLASEAIPTTVVETVISISKFTSPLSITPPTTSSNTSATSSAMISQPSSCGDTGAFTLDFDDLPVFSAAANTTQYPPIFNPYHHLFFSDGFSYVPLPKDPFPPISGNHLAVFVVNGNVPPDEGSPDAGDESYGELGAGPRAPESAYWVDAYSMYLGCNNTGPYDCAIAIDGFTYSSTAQTTVLTATQTVTQPACPGLVGCHLTQIELTSAFRSLAGIQIVATVAGDPVTWYMDNVSLGWSNNTCAAGLQRESEE